MKSWDWKKNKIEEGDTVSPKLDGVYVKATRQGLFTKNGNKIENHKLLNWRLKPHFLIHPKSQLEGELYNHGQGFEKTISDFKTGKKLKYNIFPGQKNAPLPFGGIKRIPAKPVHSNKEAKESFKGAVSNGFEGQIVHKGSGEDLKMKPQHDSEYEVAAVQKGKRHGILSLKHGGKAFRVQAKSEVATPDAIGQKATVKYNRLTKNGIPYSPVFKGIRNYDMSSLTSKTINMSLLNKNNDTDSSASSDALKAAATGAIGGAIMGAVPAFKKGSTVIGSLKGIGAGAAIGGALGGGGTYIGNKILGDPKSGEGAPVTKRAAVGGAIAGGLIGAGGVLAAKKVPMISKALTSAAETWRPAQFIKDASIPAGVAAGGVVGAAYGAHHGADEGLGVDALNSLKYNPKSQIGQFDSKSVIIKFQKLLTEDDGVPLNGRVAHDRFIKTIREQDLDRRDSNMLQAAGIGSLVGAAKTKYPFGGKLGRNVGMGALAGAAGVLAIRKLTENKRDIYGDRTRTAKKLEIVPAVAGAGILAHGAIKGVKKHLKLSSKQKTILFDKSASAKYRDLSIGTGALVAGGGVGYAGVRAAKALAQHERLAQTANQTASTVNNGVQKAASLASKLKRALTTPLKFKFSSIEFGEVDQPRNKYSKRFADSGEGWARRQKFVNGEGKDIEVLPHQAIKAYYRKGQQARVVTQRGYGLAKDLSDVAAGRQKENGNKREWEKAWFKNAATATVLGAGYLGTAALRRRARVTPNAPLSKKIIRAEAGVRKAKTDASKYIDKKVNSTLGSLGLSSKGKDIELDIFGNYSGWDIRDPRGRSARVYAPGSQRRNRRQAEWHETKEGQKKILVAAGVAGAAGVGALSSAVAYKLGGKKAVKNMLNAQRQNKALAADKALQTKIAKSEAMKAAVESGKITPFNPKKAVPSVA